MILFGAGFVVGGLAVLGLALVRAASMTPHAAMDCESADARSARSARP